MPNELPIGASRIGSLIDFDPATPATQVTLERTESGICVVVSWTSYESPYSGWFVGDEVQGLHERPVTAVPRRLLFQDSYGSVLLVGCRPRGFHTNVLGPGHGRVWARFAVLGVDEDMDFEKPNGLRTEISGLREWASISSIHEEYRFDPAPASLEVVARSAGRLEIRDGLTLEPSWSRERASDGNGVLVRDLLYCTSRSDPPLDWEESLRPHLGVRDLMVVSRWKSETCRVALAQRDDDPTRTLDGAEHGTQWRKLVMREGEQPAQAGNQHEHLIRFSEIGAGGISNWLSLRETFARALDPVISTAFLSQVTGTTLLAQTGPGIEALGYLLFIEDGLEGRAAARKTLQQRLERIGLAIVDVAPFDVSEWAVGTAVAYNGLKHANRAQPDELDVLNRWRQCVIAIRAWVALRLGVPAPALKQRLESDRMAPPYVRVT